MTPTLPHHTVRGSDVNIPLSQGYDRLMVIAALFWDGDSTAGRQAYRRLSSRAEAAATRGQTNSENVGVTGMTPHSVFAVT
jgi:hypothetical protein